MKGKPSFLLLVIAFFLSTLFAAEPIISVKAEPGTIAAGSSGKILVTYVIPKGFHQSQQEDFFYIEPGPITGFTFGKTVYPGGGEKDAEGLINYKGTVVLSAEVKVAGSVKPGSYTMTVETAYQLCEDSGACHMPQSKTTKLTLQVTGPVKASGQEEVVEASTEEDSAAVVEPTITLRLDPEQVSAGRSGKIIATFTIPEGYHQTSQPDFFFIEPEPLDGFVFEQPIYPTGKKEADGLIHYKHSVELILLYKVSETVIPGSHDLILFAGFQLCEDNGPCFMPQEKELGLTLQVAEKSAALGLDDKSIKKMLGRSEKEQAKAEKPQSSAMDILKFILLAFIGGIILNIMPCVLPVLSIKAMHLVNQSRQNRMEIMKGSLAYTAGIVFSFIILGVVVVLLKTTGESVGWGFQFQNVSFTLTLAGLIFIFSLSLFDIFVIAAPGMGLAARASSKGGHLGSFMSGVFAVLLATPCTAPFLGAALGFAFSQPPLIIMVIFVMVGIGLALPFILLAFWPKVIQMLPKPGEWMNVFKEVMGFLLIGTALYLLGTLHTLVESGVYSLSNGENFLRVIWFFVVLGFATWIYGRFSRPEDSVTQQWIAFFVAVIIAVVGSYFTLQFKVSPYFYNEENLLKKGANLEEFRTAIISESKRADSKDIQLVSVTRIADLTDPSGFADVLNSLLIPQSTVLKSFYDGNKNAIDAEPDFREKLDKFSENYDCLNEEHKIQFNRMVLESVFSKYIQELDWGKLQLGTWQKFSPELVQKYHDEGKPVFVDFGADWCATCRTNESLVLYPEDMKKEFADRGVQLLRGDYTNGDPVITKWLQIYERAGVPLYLLFYPGVEKPEVFPEIITKEMVLDKLKKLDK